MDYISMFQTHLQTIDLSESTIQAYTSDLGQFIAWVKRNGGKDFAPEQVFPSEVQQYREYLQHQRGNKPASIARQIASLSHFFQWAVEQGLCATNPTAQIKVPRMQRLAPRWLTKSEQRALLRVVERDLFFPYVFYSQRRITRRRDAAIVVLLLHTGLRVGELTSLQMQAVDLKERSGWIEVRAGKGRKTRIVPLNAVARRALQAWLQVRPEVSEGHVFIVVERSHHGPLSSRSVQRAIRRYGELAGLPKLTPHMLRHTFAKNLVEAGVSLEKVAALLGHSNLNTTRIYITPSSEDLRQAVEALPVR